MFESIAKRLLFLLPKTYIKGELHVGYSLTLTAGEFKQVGGKVTPLRHILTAKMDKSISRLSSPDRVMPKRSIRRPNGGALHVDDCEALRNLTSIPVNHTIRPVVEV